MNPKLRTRNSKGYTKVSTCNTNVLIKIITYLNNYDRITITDLIRGIGHNPSIKGGLQFLRNIKIVEKVFHSNYKDKRHKHNMVYRLNEDFKRLYNNLEEKPREFKDEINKSFKINKENLIEASINKISSKKYPHHYITVPIGIIRKYKLQRGDIIKLKPIELLRMIKIKEF